MAAEGMTDTSFAFTPEERSSLQATCSIGIDEQGREVLVGLTYVETAVFMEYQRTWLDDRRAGRRRSADERNRHRVYHDKHERARLAALGEQIAARARPSSTPPSSQ